MIDSLVTYQQELKDVDTSIAQIINELAQINDQDQRISRGNGHSSPENECAMQGMNCAFSFERSGFAFDSQAHNRFGVVPQKRLP